MDVRELGGPAAASTPINPSAIRKRKVSHIVYFGTLLTLYLVRAVTNNPECTEISGSDLAANHEIAVITERPQSEDKKYEQIESIEDSESKHTSSERCSDDECFEISDDCRKRIHCLFASLKRFGLPTKISAAGKGRFNRVFAIDLTSTLSCLALRTPSGFWEYGYDSGGSSVETSKDDFVAAIIAGAIGVGPSIQHFCCTPDNPLGCPFVLEDFVPGSSLHSILPSLTDGQRFAVAEKLVQLWTLYSQISFVAPGMLRAAPGVPDEWSRPQCFSIEDAMLLVTVQPLGNDRGPTGVTQLLSLKEQLQHQLEFLKIDLKARSNMDELYAEEIETLGKALDDLQATGMFDNLPQRPRYYLCHSDLAPRNIMVHFSEEGVYVRILDWDNSLVVPPRLAELQLLPIMMDYQSKMGDAAASDVPRFVPNLNELELSPLQRKYLLLLHMKDHPAQRINIMTVELFMPLVSILDHAPTTNSGIDYLESFSARWTDHSKNLPHNTDTSTPPTPAEEIWPTGDEIPWVARSEPKKPISGF